MTRNRRKTGGASSLAEAGQNTRFQPGRSGNPNGRPRTAKFSEACRRLAEEIGTRGLTRAEELAQYCYCRALKGSVRHAELFLNYCEGKPRQSHEISGPESGPLRFSNMSHDEIQARIAELLMKRELQAR